MSGIINKAKQAVADLKSGNQNDPAYDNSSSVNTGPHNSSLTNKADPRVDSDRDHRNDPTSRTGGYGTTQTSDYPATPANTTTSGSNAYGAQPAYDNPHSTNAGPHRSEALNKADPRVDSDRDHRNNPSHASGRDTTQTGAFGGSSTGTSDYTGGAPTGTSGFTGGTSTGASGYTQNTHSLNTEYDNPQSSSNGPYRTNVMNKVDPRIDSDRDHRADPTSHVGGQGATHTGTARTGAAAHQSSTVHDQTTYDNPRSTNSGPHRSEVLNKLDPRVDSDRDGRNDPTSRAGGYGNTQTSDYSSTTGGTSSGGYGNTQTSNYSSTTGGTSSGYGSSQAAGFNDPRSTNAGPHSSSIANKTDPRVDSDRDHRNDPTSRVGGHGQTQDTYGSGGYGQTQSNYGSSGLGNSGAGTHSSTTPGAGSNTAGPHKSDLMNKLDPRVDSDLDASKTYGGNQTHSSTSTGRY